MDIRKTAALALAMTLILTAAGCGEKSPGGSSDSGSASGSASGSTSAPPVDPDVDLWYAENGGQPEVPEEDNSDDLFEKPVCSTPAVMTSVGQGYDFEIARHFFEESGADITYDRTLGPDGLNQDIRTLIINVGASAKGLEDQNTDMETELSRAYDLVARAQELGIPVAAVHTGGRARRDALSDQFINAVFPAADAAIIISDANYDGLFTELLKATSAPAVWPDTVNDLTAAIQSTFTDKEIKPET